jgi:hypothetical protein
VSLLGERVQRQRLERWQMSMKSVWGFDPEEVMRAQRLFRAEPAEDESAYSAEEQRAARIPAGVYPQIYELRRMFRLQE